MDGFVTRRLEAVIPAEVRGPRGATEIVPFVLDTGFDGFIALAPEQVKALGLRILTAEEATLADGSTTWVSVYRVGIRWHGQFVPVVALEMDGGPLLGMALLDGSHVSMDVAGGGQLQILPIAAP